MIWALPNYFSGYQRTLDNNVQEIFRQAWGINDLPVEPGIPATLMMKAIVDDKLKALYVMGENPVLSDPDQHHVVAALNKIEFMVVQDIFMTETAQIADVVLPAASFAEKQGHFTNTERRVQQLRPALTPPGQAQMDWWIVQQIANRLGANWDYQTEQDIWQEVNQVTPQYRGITWARMQDNLHGLQWPCRDEQDAGTRVMHQHEFTRGKGRLIPVNYRMPAEMPCADYPLTLSTGRLLEQFHTGTMTRKTKGLDVLGSPKVMISVYDAEKIGVSNGDMLRLSTRRGEIEIAAFVTKRAQVGVIFLPFHFAEAAANKLTIDALDPVANIPEFKICAVKVEKVEQTALA